MEFLERASRVLDKHCRNKFKDMSVRGKDRNLFKKAETHSK